MRTFDRATFLAAKAEWESGEFGWQWQRIRRIAAEQGFIYPPTGSRHDDRDSEQPSQRAIIWRALEDNPRELEAIVHRASSWSGVVDRIIGLEARLRTDADYAARDREFDKDEPTHRQAAMSLAAILTRISDSTEGAA
jgi:hypothetical protein